MKAVEALVVLLIALVVAPVASASAFHGTIGLVGERVSVGEVLSVISRGNLTENNTAFTSGSEFYTINESQLPELEALVKIISPIGDPVVNAPADYYAWTLYFRVHRLLPGLAFGVAFAENRAVNWVVVRTAGGLKVFVIDSRTGAFYPAGEVPAGMVGWHLVYL